MDTTSITSAPTTLVLGATGSIGYAITQNLLTRRLPVTILVRDRQKADALFGDAPTLTTVTGDVQDADLLRRIALNQNFIVHAINYPYHQWVGNMESATRNVIDAATQHGATIVFPGNVYNFGNVKTPIREDSKPAPCSRKGELRVNIEAMLHQAAQGDQCRVLTIRLPDFWGPNVLNDGVAPIFEGALRGKALPWLLDTDIPHQSVYTPDAAEIIVRLMLRSQETYYDVWNYGGIVLPSVRDWFAQISELVGKPLPVRVYSRFQIQALGLFLPVLREVREMLYLYENTVLLDDVKVRTVFPDVQPTPMRQALTETLSWFARHRFGRSFTPTES